MSEKRFPFIALVLVVVSPLFLVACGEAPALGEDPAVASMPGDRAGSSRAEPGQGRFTGNRAETERFLGYYESIQLTSEGEANRVEALEALPAPCCAQFSAATCCCECNMARATWGLAKHLIAEDGADADEVRDAVSEWHRAINPDGFSGSACFTGGCARTFKNDGCGGMKRSDLVL